MVLDECVSIKAPKARFFKEPLAFKPEFVLSNEIENAEKNIILSWFLYISLKNKVNVEDCLSLRNVYRDFCPIYEAMAAEIWFLYFWILIIILTLLME